MTKGHYHHHIEEATGEPTIIEIGEPYPEELDPGVDPKLHELNRITSRFAAAGLKERKAFEAYMDGDEEDDERLNIEWMVAVEEQRLALDEYEKMVSAAKLAKLAREEKRGEGLCWTCSCCEVLYLRG